jgi:hydrogenase-4 component E
VFGSFFSSLLVLVMLLNFYCIGTSRIRSLVHGVALQGVLLGIMPLLAHEELGFAPVMISLLTVAIKGVVIPTMLLRALRELPIKREVEPLVGFVATEVLAAIGTALAVAYAQNLPLVGGRGAHLVAAASLATVFSGFLVLVTRIKAVTQIVGYLLLENGVFIFGMLLIEAMPFLVEFAILLDLVVAIFVMGIIANHIGRAFPSDGPERLSALRD